MFKTFIYGLSVTIIFSFFIYLYGIFGIFNLFIFFLFYSIIFYLFYFLWKKLRKKCYIGFVSFFIEFVKKTSLSFVTIAFILTSFAYYLNEVRPAKMPEYTISNGEKTVIFQGMSHIGSKSYYQKVKKNLTEAKQNGYVYFYEGVKPGSEESSKKFNEAIGIEFNKDLYKHFSKLYGVSHQNNDIYYGLINDLDFNVDVSMDYIIKEYEKRKSTGKNKDLVATTPININEEIIKMLADLNNKELKILVYINQAILNFIIASEETQDLIKDNYANKELFKIILDGRNEVLGSEIINTKYDKIYVTYGLLHFKGVFEILKNNDKNWEIIETNYLIPIK